MKKSLPLLAGAIAAPLLAATVAFAAVGGAAETPVATIRSSAPASPTLEAPVQLATTTPKVASTIPSTELAAQPPAVQAADDPETPTTSVTVPPTETTGVPPNEWPTPAPTTPPLASPIPSAGPVEMTISWDGLKCPRSDAWIAPTSSGDRMMCPGSATP